MQLTKSEWFTIEQALADAMAFYHFQTANMTHPGVADSILNVGRVLRKVRKECCKFIEKDSNED
jgi:hypothetical protein